jgi:D-amino-acid dehydrogenase
MFAGGHAMLGLSLAAVSGKLVEEMVGGTKASVPLEPFDVERFN